MFDNANSHGKYIKFHFKMKIKILSRANRQMAKSAPPHTIKENSTGILVGLRFSGSGSSPS